MVIDNLYAQLALHPRTAHLHVEQEYRFHKVRRWRIDYYLPAYRLAIEIEGGAWTRGRHTRGKGFIGDMEKYNALTLDGIALLRYTPSQVADGSAINEIISYTEERTCTSTP